MLEQGADVNLQHCAGTPLNRAARRGHLSCVRALVDHGADVGLSGHFNCQSCKPLHAAASNGHYEVIQFLIDRGADVNATREQGSTPLHDAARFGHPEVAELLLQHGAQVNVRNAHSRTAVYYAAKEGMLDALRWLLEAVVEYYHYRGYYYNKRFYPKDAVEYLNLKQNSVNTLNMADLQDLRRCLLENDVDAMKQIVENRPAGNLKLRHLKLLKVLLDAGANTEILDKYECGPIEQAIINADEECISFLLKHGTVVNRAGQIDDAGGTPLHDVRTSDCARLLVDHGADVTAVTKNGRSVLFSPSDRYGEGACVQFLIDKGVDLLKEDENGVSPLDLAVERWYYDCSYENDDGGLEAVKILMQHGAKLKNTDGDFNKAVKSRHLGLALALLRSGRDVNAVGEDGLTALFCAVQTYFTRAVEMLLEEGADPNVKCNKVSPLYTALVKGFEGCARVLLLAGAVAEPDIYNSALSMRIYRNLLKQLNMVDQRDSEGNSQLHIECYRCASILDLVEAGADTNVVDQLGVSPLHIACYAGNTSHVQLLIENKADPNKKDVTGLSPLHFAAFKGHHDVAVALLENGADANAPDEKGRTPAHVAAQYGCSKYLEQLLTRGAQVNVKDKLGWSPLHEAERSESTDCIDLLVKHGADTT
ncbi:hypothetical protein L9F63_001128, partial [Diploptera punctata]